MKTKTKPKRKMTMTPPSEGKKVDRSTREAKALEAGTKRLTLDMPVAAHRDLKMLAAKNGMTMRVFIKAALGEKGLRWD